MIPKSPQHVTERFDIGSREGLEQEFIQHGDLTGKTVARSSRP